jgi:hypothetical protein
MGFSFLHGFVSRADFQGFESRPDASVHREQDRGPIAFVHVAQCPLNDVAEQFRRGVAVALGL